MQGIQALDSKKGGVCFLFGEEVIAGELVSFEHANLHVVVYDILDETFI